MNKNFAGCARENGYFPSRALIELATRRRMLSGKAQLALAVVIGAAFALCYPFRLTNTRAFKIAFGKPPPADIKIEHADCYYHGGGGDYGLYLAFTGPEARIEELLAGCELVRDESAEESGHYDALYFPHPDWASVESGGPWQVYKSPMNSTATWMRRGVFIYAYWDRRSNRVILAYLMG